MSKLVAVKFLKAWNGYSADEVAGFDSATADRLVAGEVAELRKGQKVAGSASGKVSHGAGTAAQSAESDVGADQAGSDHEAKP